MRAAIVVSALGLVTLGACGGGSGPASEAQAQLHLTVWPGEDEADFRTATLRCSEERSEGSGFLEEQAVSAAACAALRDDRVRRHLVDGPPADRVCTQIYGGPQRAKIVGVIDGQQVDIDVNRTDGCGIEDWRMLEPLLGPPG